MANTDLQNHSFQGICNICGEKGTFAHTNPSLRESYPCPSCQATLRYRDQAGLIVDEFGKGLSVSVAHMVRSGLLDGVAIYEVAIQGPLTKYLRKLPHYIQSYYWQARKLGSTHNGVRCEDLTQLTFMDNSFDLVITSDVMEHVLNPIQAFTEIHRVLKPFGVHIFTIPNRWPLPAKTEKFVEVVDNSLKYLQPPRYHIAGDKTPSLVVSEFGEDLIDTLSHIGFLTKVVRRHLAVDVCYRNATFISYKLP